MPWVEFVIFYNVTVDVLIFNKKFFFKFLNLRGCADAILSAIF